MLSSTLDLPIISDEKDELIERVVDTYINSLKIIWNILIASLKQPWFDNAAIKAVVANDHQI